jgi:dimethylamine/trimethylamine dehydrogenase
MFRGIRPNSGSSHVFPDWLRHLAARQGDCADAGLRTVTTIGDAQTPSTIASAVYSGHKFGGELGLTVDDPALNIGRESPCWRTIPVHWARC